MVCSETWWSKGWMVCQWHVGVVGVGGRVFACCVGFGLIFSNNSPMTLSVAEKSPDMSKKWLLGAVVVVVESAAWKDGRCCPDE